LTVEQITAILEDKRVLGPKKDILEVKNAIAVYERLNEFKSWSLTSFLRAHEIMMEGLITSPGSTRRGNVGVLKGTEITHLAPSGEMVRPLLNDLFKYLKSYKEIILIKSCVFHYEIEFIHPFMDGNGRLGRLWQTIILKEQYPLFEFLPIETIIKKRQAQYYNALNKSDKSGTSTPFIEFMLEVINESLEELLSSRNISLSGEDRILLYKSIVGTKTFFARRDYLRNFKEISPATASRDLREAVEKGVIKKMGDKNTTTYCFF
jgi:Fic family protein